MRSHWISPAAALALILAVVIALTPTVAATDILYQTGLEPPTFETGTFAGQDSWDAYLGAPSATVATELPLTSTGLPLSGAHSLRVDGSQLEEFFGFHFASYARPLLYDPIGSATRVVTLSADINLAGDVPEGCGFGIGLSGILNGEFMTNVQIGVRSEDGKVVPFIANYDGVVATRSRYKVGKWATLRAVYDFERRTVRGFYNNVPIGEIPFTAGISNDIHFIVVFMGSHTPVPTADGHLDNLEVSAAP